MSTRKVFFLIIGFTVAVITGVGIYEAYTSFMQSPLVVTETIYVPQEVVVTTEVIREQQVPVEVTRLVEVPVEVTSVVEVPVEVTSVVEVPVEVTRVVEVVPLDSTVATETRAVVEQPTRTPHIEPVASDDTDEDFSKNSSFGLLILLAILILVLAGLVVVAVP